MKEKSVNKGFEKSDVAYDCEGWNELKQYLENSVLKDQKKVAVGGSVIITIRIIDLIKVLMYSL